MPSPLDNVERVAIVRLRSLGDCILTTPAVQLLREYRPHMDIRVVVEERFAAVFSKTLPPSVNALREFAPQLCLNLHGGSRSARLTALSGAGGRAGFQIFRPQFIYNIHIPTAQETLGIARRVHTAEHLASAMFHLGVPLAEVPPATMGAPPGRSPIAPAGAYAVIHPFAATPEKAWPAACFLELARSLSLIPVFIGSAADDLSPFSAWPTVSGAPLEQIAALMRDASLFVGNDSGPAHVAAAFAVPVLVFFGPSDHEVWRPWKTQAEVLRAEGPIQSIAVDDARRALERLTVRAH